MPKERTPKTFVGQRQQRNLNASALAFCCETLPVNYPVLDNSSCSTLVGGAVVLPHCQATTCNEESAVCNTISPSHSSVASDEDSDSDNYAHAISSEEEEGLAGTSWHLESLSESEETTEEDNFKISLADWAVVSNIPRTHITKLLVLMRQFTPLNFLPADYRTLLKTVRNVNVKKLSSGDYFHFGLEKGILRHLFRYPHLASQITSVKVFINVDGIPLTKSTNSQFWPILGKLQESVFVIGIFHGCNKPADFNEYLSDFISEAVLLQTNGIVFRDKVLSFSVAALVCDAPARSQVTFVKAHTAYFGCHKCVIRGEFYRPNVNQKSSGRVTYPQVNAPLRTNSSFREKLNADHHTGVSSFERLTIDMIADVPLDSLHLTDLGLMKKLFITWSRGKYQRVRLSKESLSQLSQRIENCRQYIPDDFARKLGPLELLDRWKGTCFRMIKLYLGPVILRNLLPDHLYKHFVTFHVAMKLLSDGSQSCKDDVINYCKQLLINFVKDCVPHYGQQFVSYNVHNLIHVSEDVKHFGPLDFYSAYPFENELQVLKNLLRKSSRPIQQIVKRIEENEVNKMIADVPKCCEIRVSQEHMDGPLLPGVFGVQYRTLFYKQWRLTTTKPNNCIYLIDGSIAIVQNIIVKNDQFRIIGRKFEKMFDHFEFPLKSSKLRCFVVKDLGNLFVFSVFEIFAKGFIMPSFICETNSYAVYPLLKHDSNNECTP